MKDTDDRCLHLRLRACRCEAGLHDMQKACSAKTAPQCMEEVPEPCPNNEHIIFRKCHADIAPLCQAPVHSLCDGFASVAGEEPERHVVLHRCCGKRPKCVHCQQRRRANADRRKLEEEMAKCAHCDHRSHQVSFMQQPQLAVGFCCAFNTYK